MAWACHRSRMSELLPPLLIAAAGLFFLQVRTGLEEGIHAEVEGYRAQLEGVKAALAPWERQMKEVQARIDVAASEHGLLTKQHEDAKNRFASAQLSLKAAQETTRNKAGQVKEMEAAVEKYRCGGGSFGCTGRVYIKLRPVLPVCACC